MFLISQHAMQWRTRKFRKEGGGNKKPHNLTFWDATERDPPSSIQTPMHTPTSIRKPQIAYSLADIVKSYVTEPGFPWLR